MGNRVFKKCGAKIFQVGKIVGKKVAGPLIRTLIEHNFRRKISKIRGQDIGVKRKLSIGE